MGGKQFRWIGGIALLSYLISNLAHPLIAGAPTYSPDSVRVTIRGADPEIQAQVGRFVPSSIQMVDHAIAVLSKGWDGLSPEERAEFSRFFDPSSSEGIDERFVQDVLENYRKIRRLLDRDLTLVYEPESSQCQGMRMYYTDFIRVHLCPYLKTETNVDRMARDYIHELAHMALISLDRPYYYPTSSAYAALTPRGPQGAAVPVIGRLIAEIVRSDTLYHADAYAWFALKLTVPDYGAPSGLYETANQVAASVSDGPDPADSKFSR